MSSDSEFESDMELEDVYDYLDQTDDFCDISHEFEKQKDIEHFQFDCLSVKGVEDLLNEKIQALCNNFHITRNSAKILLNSNQWALTDVVQNIKTKGIEQVLIDSRIKPSKLSTLTIKKRKSECRVCMDKLNINQFRYLECGHLFCISCWKLHFEVQLSQGISTGIECMEKDCKIIVPEDFAFSVLIGSNLREKYQQFLYNDYVGSNPNLVFCPGADCKMIIYAQEIEAKRVTCSECKTIFCFKCVTDYHVPCDCATIKKWRTKCADDSETANYIMANTKECPRCKTAIEKNGGCYYMACFKCKYAFCWICLGDWKLHNDHYKCNHFVEDVNAATSDAAQEALRKYLFYYDRWANHINSLKLEEKMMKKIQERIDEKVMNKEGTWIDWQYLFDGGDVLAKCRYTLQYTYAYAYYLESGTKKEMFEDYQFQLEQGIEALSFQIQHADITVENRGEIENKMAMCEKRRVLLIQNSMLNN